MKTLPWKLGIALLWALGPVLELAHLMLYLRIDEKGTTRLGNLVVHSTLFSVVPLLLCVLSLTLRDKANKRMNIVLGVLVGFVLSLIWFLEGGLGVIAYEGPPLSAQRAILLGFKTVLMLLIPWFAWRWPKESAQPVRRRYLCARCLTG
jgi:hypothetical protein